MWCWGFNLGPSMCKANAFAFESTPRLKPCVDLFGLVLCHPLLLPCAPLLALPLPSAQHT